MNINFLLNSITDNAGTDSLRRSTREQKSTGGALHKFERVGEALKEKEKESKKKKGGEGVPESAPVNPLAPGKPSRRGRKKRYEQYLFILLDLLVSIGSVN